MPAASEPNAPTRPWTGSGVDTTTLVRSAIDVVHAWNRLFRHLDEAERLETVPDSELVPDRYRDTIDRDLVVLSDRWDSLGDMFDRVTDYWIAESPPAFCPSASSVLEGIIRLTRRLSIYLSFSWKVSDGNSAENTAPSSGGPPQYASWRAVAHFVRRHCPRPQTSEVIALMRCEAARLQVMQDQILKEGNGGIPFNGSIRPRSERHSHNIEWELANEFTAHIPDSWDDLTDEERLAALDGTGANPANTARKPGRPKDPLREKIAARAAELHAEGMPWKEVTATVNSEFKKHYEVSTITKYGSTSRTKPAEEIG